MDFNLTEEQRMIQDMAYKFAVNEIKPKAKEHDAAETYPREICLKAAENGLVGPVIPEVYGGAGLGWLEASMICEQLSRVDLGIAQSIESSPFGYPHILDYGTEEQKKKYLPSLASGKLISAGAYTEPDAGTDLVSIRTKAVKDGDDYVITGNKIFITNGTVCDYMIVLCVTNPEAEKPYLRQSLILVEADRAGVTASKIKGKMGLRASDTAEISYDEVRVPQENLIGKEGRGFYQLMHFLDASRTVVSGQGLGVAQGAFDLALKYTRERKTFGRPLFSNQAIQFQLAEMATRIEMARNTTYKAAWLVDSGKPDPSINAMAKYYAAETAVWVCDHALQMHGGYGYIDEFDIERFYRHAKVLEIYEGAKEAEKMTISRRLS